MSKRLATRADRSSSSSVAPVGGSGCRGSLVIGSSLDEDDVQDDEYCDRHAAEQLGRAPPELVARVWMLLGFGVPREAPNQAAQSLLGLRLCEERDDHEHRGIDEEGDDRLPEAR